MIVAVCSSEKHETAPIDTRFGRCPYFMLYNSEKDEYWAVENTAKDAPGGAGGKAVQLLIGESADIVIAPEIGPKAADVLVEFEIPVYLPPSPGEAAYSCKHIIELWKQGELKLWSKPKMQNFGTDV
jgi:predicted Fe-Mo cluster-binding NifX family protein